MRHVVFTALLFGGCGGAKPELPAESAPDALEMPAGVYRATKCEVLGDEFVVRDLTIAKMGWTLEQTTFTDRQCTLPEGKHGIIPRGGAVFVSSGWDARAARGAAFLNRDRHSVMRFPGFSAEAAAFLLHSRRVAGIGIDTLSIDRGSSETYDAHRIWLAGGGWAVEAAANLSQVPAVGATVFVGAAKVRGATGGPVRLFAAW